jgi:hypothetical protein
MLAQRRQRSMKSAFDNLKSMVHVNTWTRTETMHPLRLGLAILHLALYETESRDASFLVTTLGPAFCVGAGIIMRPHLPCRENNIRCLRINEKHHVLANAFGLRKQISLECLCTESQAKCPTWIYCRTVSVSCIKTFPVHKRSSSLSGSFDQSMCD